MTLTFAQFSARLGDFIRRTAGLANGTPVRETETEFNQLALALFALQFKHNLAYRKLCEVLGTSRNGIRDWTQIPAAPTAAFKELELTSLPACERTTVFHSSGTTGERPSRHFHHRASLAVYEASLRPWFRRHLVPDLDQTDGADGQRLQFISLTPPAESAPRSSLVHMFDSVRLAFGSRDSLFAGSCDDSGLWQLDPEPLLKVLEMARRPVVLLGTAFSFVHLVDALAARSLCVRLPTGSRALETGGYKGRSRTLPPAELHALISEHLGIAPDHIVCEYGMSELSSQAYDGIAGLSCDPALPSRNLHFPPWVRVQIVSPETGREVAEGETGLIRVFDLANVWSVLAVQTEDLGIRYGDGFALLGRAPQAEPRGCSLMTA